MIWCDGMGTPYHPIRRTGLPALHERKVWRCDHDTPKNRPAHGFLRGPLPSAGGGKPGLCRAPADPVRRRRVPGRRGHPRRRHLSPGCGPGSCLKTSLPAAQDISDAFDAIAAAGYDGVIALMLSGGLSGTYNMVRLLAEERRDLDDPGL